MDTKIINGLVIKGIYQFFNNLSLVDYRYKIINK